LEPPRAYRVAFAIEEWRATSAAVTPWRPSGANAAATAV
jgi:hypothetical protein